MDLDRPLLLHDGHNIYYGTGFVEGTFVVLNNARIVVGTEIASDWPDKLKRAINKPGTLMFIPGLAIARICITDCIAAAEVPEQINEGGSDA
jgi:hypothetical protein